MPGLIDAHTHIFLNIEGGVPALESATWDEIGPRSAHMAATYLANGFTTVREMGGGGSGLKKTVDAGLLDGPRIYPSGAFLSQTSGHGDLRHSSQRNSNLAPYMDSNAERFGVTAVVDGPERSDHSDHHERWGDLQERAWRVRVQRMAKATAGGLLIRYQAPAAFHHRTGGFTALD